MPGLSLYPGNRFELSAQRLVLLMGAPSGKSQCVPILRSATSQTMLTCRGL